MVLGASLSAHRARLFPFTPCPFLRWWRWQRASWAAASWPALPFPAGVACTGSSSLRAASTACSACPSQNRVCCAVLCCTGWQSCGDCTQQLRISCDSVSRLPPVPCPSRHSPHNLCPPAACPPRAGGRTHTSTASVAVLPQAEDVEVAIRDEDLRIDTYRCARLAVQHSS